MLRSDIFMAHKIDNTTNATQKGALLSALSSPICDSQSITLTTLAGRASSALIDGHTMPSENAVTPAASTRVAELMDTLFGPFVPCNIVTSTIFAPSTEATPPTVEVGFSRHACREKSPASPAASTKPPELLDTLLSCLKARRPIEN
jgi:hypothetical protein